MIPADHPGGRRGSANEPTQLDESERSLSPASDGILVEVVGGPMDGLRRQVATSVLTLGRGEENDLHLPLDPLVSTEHARIQFTSGQFWLEDLQSTNGTFLAQGRVDGRVLIGPGTCFTIGRTVIELMPSRKR